MNRFASAVALALIALFASDARADFVLNFDHSDFGTTSVFNDVSEFSFTVSVAGPLVADGVYNNPTLTGVDYRVLGVLTQSTPSGFPGFNLVRSMTGAEFYGLSPESGVSFTVAPTADLSDGLQVSELVGGGIVFQLNAREFNQNPGRYHPPIFTLNADGTGRLVNANNQSTFNNPPPPQGSGQPVDVNIADEYDVTLSFSPSLTIAPPLPEPGSAALVFLGVAGWMALARRRRSADS